MHSRSSETESSLVEEVTYTQLTQLPGFLALLDEYMLESNPDLDAPKANFEQYERMDAAGALTVFAALSEGAVVGIAVMVVMSSAHHSRPVAHSESLFVARSHRKGTTLGVQLIRRMQERAEGLGCQGLGISVPVFRGRALERLCAGMGFNPTHTVMFHPCKN